MSDAVRSPTLAACCGAVASLATGLVRPRRPDQRFLRGLTDAGLPDTAVSVTVSALRQVPRSVPTALIVEGLRQPRRIANSLLSFVITHPETTFIVDPGVCLDVDSRAVATLPPFLRVAVRPPADTVATVTALHELPRSGLDFALPTHTHWDHVSGLLDLPELPVHLHRREHDWVMQGPIAPVGGVREALRGRDIVPYELDGPPILTFTASHDLFGDGSVVLVDLAGHTPGSIGVLAHTATGWVLLAGDAAWHTDQIDLIRQKAGYPGKLADEDRHETFRTLHRLHAVKDRVTIIPTHDHRAAQQLPT
ncbi:MBL fold metallo-hydrolase [Streptomyces sp. NBC_00247]|uniref:MBL fold metallo-hydrolase n=1 Tax=Streptomyces sp. NBC_00247 TaxID=2975689 RepID=UPI002E28BF73|nr:MBL fold metallo-hydrolase [Streptomyces sp. NBC_00247]